LRDREGVGWALEDVWEGGEEEKEDCESEACVEGEEEHDGLFWVSTLYQRRGLVSLTSVTSMCKGLKPFCTSEDFTPAVLIAGGVIPSFFARRFRMMGL
jgi:hypothetical protein